MTRKDYELIAEVIATSWHGSAELKEALAQRMAEALASTNERFNTDRFIKACM